MGQITNGIDLIEIGDTGTDGAMATSLRVLGHTNIDSASITEADGTVTDFLVEELDTPIYSTNVPGKKTMTFQVADPDLEAFQEVFGGTITGTGDAAVWNAPQTIPRREISIKITPKIGYIIQIPRAILMPRLSADLGKNRLVMIEVTADILNPQDTDIAPIMFGGVATPTT